MVPMDQVYDLIEFIMSDMPLNVLRIEEFLELFVATYFENSYPLKLWNHYDTVNESRTNNHLEGYN